MANYNLLREIDPHQNELKFSGNLNCIVDKTTEQIKGYYNTVFGPFMWQLPINTYELSSEPEYWNIIIVYALLNGQIFEKFKILQKKLIVDPNTLTLESILSNAKIFRLASVIKQFSLYDVKRLREFRDKYRNELLVLVKEGFVAKVDKAYDKLFM